MFNVIKYDSDGKTLIYKHPVEDFNTKSQLIVQQSQEAIFYYKGEKADVFKSGTYTLETNNIPILRRLVNLPFGGDAPFHAVVYFVDKTEMMQLRWGTSERIGILEPTYGFPMKIGASGEMSIRIADCELMMDKLVGSRMQFTQDDFVNSLRALIQTEIKTCLAKTFLENHFNIFTIETELKDLSNVLKSKVAPGFREYGVSLESLLITNIVRPEDDPNYQRISQMVFERGAGMESIKIQNEQERLRMEFEFEMQMRQQDISARAVMVDANAQAEKRRIEGYDYRTERGFNVAELTAQNEGAGNFAAAGMGMGMGFGIGTSAGEKVGAMYTGALSMAVTGTGSETENGQSEFSYMGDIGLDAVFKENVEEEPIQKTVSRTEERRLKLRELKEDFEEGLIDEQEYKELKAELLKNY